MDAPDLCFMVHSSEVVDEEGRSQRGSRMTAVDPGSEPPEWVLRDFAFAAFGRDSVPGLRPYLFGRKEVWAFATPREHCEEIVVFRRGSDLARKWDEEEHNVAKVGLDMFFVMRTRQITNATPLSKQFNGEWGFWESFYAPIIDEEQTMGSFSGMDASTCNSYFAQQRLPVQCHKCPVGHFVLTIPESMVVRYQVKVPFRDADAWSDVCSSIGEDMLLQSPCTVEKQHIARGSECIRVLSEMDGLHECTRLRKHELQLLKLPLELTFECDMKVAAEWRPDVASLQKKFDDLGALYQTNLLGGFNTLAKLRPDPWNPMARLAVNALSRFLARHPGIRSILDVGCGDMSWMRHVLEDNPQITYIGVDIQPFCLWVNFNRFPKLHFIQTDLSNLKGMEIMPCGCDLVVAKDLFNYMALPDAVNAMKRVVCTRPKYLLTHIHRSSDNTGWETRIDKHQEYTEYNYNKPPFSLPYPVVDIQRISDDACFVLYQIVPDLTDSAPPPPPQEVGSLSVPLVGDDLDIFTTVEDGEWTEPKRSTGLPATCREDESSDEDAAPTVEADSLGPRAAADHGDSASTAGAESTTSAMNPIKGIPVAEFKARCNLIFDKFDRDKDDVLSFEELAALMEAGGRRIDQHDAYVGLCGRLGCDARIGLRRKDVFTLFQKAPQAVWEQVYRSINPVAQLVVKGSERLADTFLQRPIVRFDFDDEAMTARVHVDLNSHLYFGAAETVTEDHVQVRFGKQRLEIRIVAPGSFGANDMYLWKLVVSPLSGEIVPEDCSMNLKVKDGNISTMSKKVVVKLTKSKQNKWKNLGMASV